MRKVIFVRGLEIAHVPGSGSTSLLVRDYEGKDATAEVYKVDTALLAELRNHELQAAQELGRWDTKSEAAAFDPVEMVRLLHEGRRRGASSGKRGKWRRLQGRKRRSEARRPLAAGAIRTLPRTGAQRSSNWGGGAQRAKRPPSIRPRWSGCPTGAQAGAGSQGRKGRRSP
jgi:hypothetical protein